MADQTEISFAELFFCSAFAACFAELCTIPLDTAKVRLQLQKRAALSGEGGTPKYKGLLGTIVTIAKEEGLLALWKGIIPGLHRQFIYGGLRINLYGPVKAFCSGGNVFAGVSLFQKILAALITGAIAITLANPTDLVKVRLQAEGKLPPGAPRYSGALSAYYTIIKEVKSRMMGDSIYKSTLDCMVKTLRVEGALAFYKGFLPNFGRLGSWNVIMFLTLEQVKRLFS